KPATLTPYEPLTSIVHSPSRFLSLGPCDATTTEQRSNFSRITRTNGNGTRLASVKRRSEKPSRMDFAQAIDRPYRARSDTASRSRAFLRVSTQDSGAPSARRNSSSVYSRDLTQFASRRESTGIHAIAGSVVMPLASLRTAYSAKLATRKMTSHG